MANVRSTSQSQLLSLLHRVQMCTENLTLCYHLGFFKLRLDWKNKKKHLGQLCNVITSTQTRVS